MSAASRLDSNIATYPGTRPSNEQSYSLHSEGDGKMKREQQTRNKIERVTRQDEKSESQEIHRKINTFIFTLTLHTIIAISL